MLALAYRKQAEPIRELLSNGALVPVSLSYEVDPCAPAKARELAALARDGEYAKGEEEDLDSMIQGLVGYKGQVHVHFSPPIAQDCDSVEQLVERLDSAIVVVSGCSLPIDMRMPCWLMRRLTATRTQKL